MSQPCDCSLILSFVSVPFLSDLEHLMQVPIRLVMVLVKVFLITMIREELSPFDVWYPELATMCPDSWLYPAPIRRDVVVHLHSLLHVLCVSVLVYFGELYLLYSLR